MVEVIATSALRQSQGFSRPIPDAVSIVGYCVSFYLLSLIVQQIPLGVAYAIWAGAGTALIAGVGAVVFDEHLSLGAALGIALIIAGIVAVETFGK